MSSQTTTTPANRPNLQERGRRAEQREVNLHEPADPRNPNPHRHPANHWKTTHPPACRKHGKTGGERHRTTQDHRKNPTTNQHPGVSPPHKEHMRNPTPLYEGRNRLGRTGGDIHNEIHVEIQRGPPTGGSRQPSLYFSCYSVIDVDPLEESEIRRRFQPWPSCDPCSA